MTHDTIQVVSTNDPASFTKQVNALLAQGWKLHGPPAFTAASQQDSWDDRQRAWVEYAYTQALVKTVQAP